MSRKIKKVEKINKTSFKWNIGLLLFAVIALYLVVLLVQVSFRENTSTYEVKRGSINRETVYTGLVIREESVINAEKAGYIEYYYPELSRVGIGHHIYTISDEPYEEASTESELTELTPNQINDISSKVQSFNAMYSDLDFDQVYRFKSDIETILTSEANEERIRTLDIYSKDDKYDVYDTAVSGVILYEVDGYESLVKGDIKDETFLRQAYSKSLLSSGTQVKAGEPAYKIATGEIWKVFIQIQEEQINELKDIRKLDVRFLKDDAVVPADFSLTQINGKNYGELIFNEGMVRYATDRLLDVELILENKIGFKIPKTSVTQESFYKIPDEFILKGGYVLIKESTGEIKKHEITTFYRTNVDVDADEDDEEIDHYYYIPTSNLSLNDVLIQEDTNDTYIVSDTEVLNIAYELNRGYARMKYVDVLSQSEEYYIVRELSKYSLVNYDYIALYAKDIKEGELVY